MCRVPMSLGELLQRCPMPLPTRRAPSWATRATSTWPRSAPTVLSPRSCEGSSTRSKSSHRPGRCGDSSSCCTRERRSPHPRHRRGSSLTSTSADGCRCTSRSIPMQSRLTGPGGSGHPAGARRPGGRPTACSAGRSAPTGVAARRGRGLARLACQERAGAASDRAQRGSRLALRCGGIWSSKEAAAGWALGRAEDPSLVEAAMAVRHGDHSRALDPTRVRRFVTGVQARVAEAMLGLRTCSYLPIRTGCSDPNRLLPGGPAGDPGSASEAAPGGPARSGFVPAATGRPRRRQA
jgi:hypothetical protein